VPSRARLRPMNVALRKPWTPERFLAWAETQEERYEFDGIQPVAMTGGNKRHDVITRNISSALHSRLRAKPCSNYGPNLGVQTIGRKIRYPDALITCTRFPDSAKLAPNVVVVFEVVSPSTGGLDRIEKVREYEAVPSILRYVIVESATAGLMVLHRDNGEAAWTAHTTTIAEVLAIPEVAIEVPVAEFYEDVEFEDAASSDAAG
jgi:Uma2 family endonuclease